MFMYWISLVHQHLLIICVTEHLIMHAVLTLIWLIIENVYVLDTIGTVKSIMELTKLLFTLHSVLFSPAPLTFQFALKAFSRSNECYCFFPQWTRLLSICTMSNTFDFIQYYHTVD